jgi:putative transposase
MVSHPSEYRWSSYREKTVEGLKIVDPDPAFMEMAEDEEQRKQAYERWVLSAVLEGEWERIRDAIQRGHLTGKHQLEEEVAEILGVRLEMKKPGRPKKYSGRKED